MRERFNPYCSVGLAVAGAAGAAGAGAGGCSGACAAASAARLNTRTADETKDVVRIWNQTFRGSAWLRLIIPQRRAARPKAARFQPSEPEQTSARSRAGLRGRGPPRI